jgi:16S rRNA (guanine527-N7)-methyltransferase
LKLEFLSNRLLPINKDKIIKLANFQIFRQLLLDWNQRINLVSRQDIDRLVSYHFIDSISAIPEIPLNSIVCDLGTGAGLPGIPVKIIRDDITLYLIESIKKKAYFLSEAIKELELKKSYVLNQRAETIQDKKFDVILVRLFGKIPDVLPIASKLLSPKGKIIFYKIEGVEKEIERANKIANKYKLKFTAVKDVKLPITDIIRKLVIFHSIKHE